MLIFASSSFVPSSSFFPFVSGGVSSSFQVSSAFDFVTHKTLGNLEADFTKGVIQFRIQSQSTGGSEDIKALVISSSGDRPKIGVGTTDPKSTFDFKDVQDSTAGTELLLRTSRTAQGALTGDEGGNINFVIDSSSFNDITTTGSIGRIRTEVKEVSAEGVSGKLKFTLAKGIDVEVPILELAHGEGTFSEFFATITSQSFEIKDASTSSTSSLRANFVHGSENTPFTIIRTDNPNTGNEGGLVQVNDKFGTGSIFLHGPDGKIIATEAHLTSISASGIIQANQYAIQGKILSTFSSDTLRHGFDSNLVKYSYGKDSDNEHFFFGNITASANISASGNLVTNQISSSGAVNLGGVLTIPGFPNVSSSLAAAVAGGDNLGNHTATQDLNMGGNAIVSVGNVDGVDISTLNTNFSTLNGKTLISSSTQIASDISGSFNAASASFSTRVTANDVKLTANTSNVTSAGALMDSELAEIATVKSLTAAGISGSFNAASASFSTRVTANDAKVGYTDAAVTGVINTAGVISSSAQFGSSDNVTFGNIEATNLNVTSITSSIVTSSIVQTEGSNIFGDAISDTQTFNGHITASGNISASGDLSALDLDLFGGGLSIKNQGAQSYARFYCEVNNAHYTEVKAQPHANFSGNPTLLLPAYDFNFASPDFGSADLAANNLSGTNTGDQDLSGLALKTAISGAFNAPSASFSTRVTANDAKLTANTSNVTSAGALMDSELTEITTVKTLTAAGISGSFNAASASFSTRVTANDAKLTANTSNVTSAGALMDSELTEIATVKALTKAGISGSFNASSASFSTRVTTSETNISNLQTDSGSFSTRVTANDAKLTANTSNVTSAGALMDSELSDLAAVKAINQGLTTTSNVTFNDVDIDGVLTIPGFANVSTSLAGVIAGGDNLGNHTATQDINLDGNSIKGILHITASGNISSSNSIITKNVIANEITSSGNVNIEGVLSLPGLANVSTSLAAAVAGGDNLGNHTATQDLNMGSNDITSVGNVDGVDISTLNTNFSTLSGKTLVSSSAQIASDISGSFNAASASFSTRVTANDAKLTADTSNVTSAGALMDSEVTNLAFVKSLASGISNGNVLVANAAVADDDFLKIDGTSVEGRSIAEVKTDLSLSNVTNESKATMFTSPTLTGNVTASGNISSSAKITSNTLEVDSFISLGGVDSIVNNASTLTFGNNSNALQIRSSNLVSIGSGINTFTGHISSSITSTGSFGHVICTDLEAAGGITVTRNVLEKTSNTDHSHQGDVVFFGGTTSMTQGDLYYFNSSGNWAQADADAVASSGGCLLAIALGTASDTNGMLLRGIYTMDANAIDGSEATGDELYVSTTAGHVTNTAPSGNGDIVRIIGYCLDGTNGQIWFNPSNDFIEITA